MCCSEIFQLSAFLCNDFCLGAKGVKVQKSTIVDNRTQPQYRCAFVKKLYRQIASENSHGKRRKAAVNPAETRTPLLSPRIASAQRVTGVSNFVMLHRRKRLPNR